MTERFRSAFEQSPSPCLLLDRDLRIVAATQAYLQATMTERAAITGRSLFEVFPDNPDDPGADGVRNLRASLERVLATAKPDAMAVQKYDVRRPASEGGGFEVRYWSPRNWPVLENGVVAFVVHQVEDVTAFIQLREQSATQSTQYAALRTHAGQMEAEIVNRARELQTSNEQLREAQAALRRFNEELERRVQHESEARARAEAEFRQAQKMEAVGLLAGGIAHDFNNLLTVILTCSSLVLDDLEPDHTVRADVADIQQAAQRAATLTRQLLAFSRRQVLTPASLCLNEVVEQSRPLLQRLLGERFALEAVCARDLAITSVDRGLLEQVLMNLVVNARDAMPDGGTIIIETANTELDDDAHGVLGAPPGHYVMLAVTDTGTGMSDETKEQLFLPFFTTKGVGRGTGLGLSMVHGAVKQSGGELIVYSVLGKGSSFKVFLPMQEGTRQALPAPDLAVPDRLPGVTVLLVEDEEAVRAVTTRCLERAGVTVITAARPDEALELGRDPNVRFDVVLSDVVMPSMEGPTFIEQLSKVRSGFAVVFMSGYTGGALVHQRVLQSAVPFLQKPFTPHQLLGRLNEALQSARPLGQAAGSPAPTKQE
ncbi:MAG: response regulator [Archangium sp.]|nr:response regulator [Archangium sp.]